jgi:diacylglycerol kinase family enzyme
MKDCLILINDRAGKCRRCSVESVKKAIGKEGESYRYTTLHLPSNKPIDYTKFDGIAVCGGDGTLQIIMQQIYQLDKTVYYFPCGTLNDKAGAEKYCHTTLKPHSVTVGKANQTLFTYVYASGAFTEIGYTASQQSKRKLGVIAYLLKVLRSYRVNRIDCKVETDGKTYEGEYNLIMFIKSPRCFGFHFNRIHDEKDAGGHMLLISSPKHNGIIGKVEMFFPFFRVFFVGLRHEIDKNGITFKRVLDAKLTLGTPTNFCVDGEKLRECGEINLSFQPTACRLKIIDVKK